MHESAELFVNKTSFCERMDRFFLFWFLQRQSDGKSDLSVHPHLAVVEALEIPISVDLWWKERLP